MLDWQMACALGIVAVATGLLVRRALLYFTSKATTSCGGCPNKSAPQLMKVTPLVQITVSPTSRNDSGL